MAGIVRGARVSERTTPNKLVKGQGKINLTFPPEVRARLHNLAVQQEADSKMQGIVGVHSSQWPEEMHRHNSIVQAAAAAKMINTTEF